MMRLKVVKAFADYVITYKTYGVGEIISLPDDRALKAIEKGLAVEIAEDKVEAKVEAKLEEAPKQKPAKKPAKKTAKKG